MIKASYD